MLSDHPGPTLVIVCRRCGRHDEHDVATLLARGDARLVDLRATLTADCPRAKAHDLRERCDTRYERCGVEA